MRTCVRVSDLIQLDSAGKGDSIPAWSYYIDPETKQPHIYRHGVAEPEVEDVIRRPMEDRPGREGSRVALGRT